MCFCVKKVKKLPDHGALQFATPVELSRLFIKHFIQWVALMQAASQYKTCKRSSVSMFLFASDLDEWNRRN